MESNEQTEQLKNPCADCKESAFSTTCRCEEFLRYQMMQKMNDHAKEVLLRGGTEF